MLTNRKMIVNENPLKYELQIGWAFHYWVAIIYGFGFYFLVAFDILDTSVLSGLIFGLVSVFVPWFFFFPQRERVFWEIKRQIQNSPEYSPRLVTL